MFCDSCGAPLQAGQGFCTRCGKAVVGPVSSQSSRVARHAQPLGILWIAYSAFAVIGGGVLFIIANTLFARFHQFGPYGPNGNIPGAQFPVFLQPLLTFVACALVLKGIAGIAAGVGILQRADWARTLAIVVACVSLLSMPFGTAIGVYTLWVLLSPNAEADFRARAVEA